MTLTIQLAVKFRAFGITFGKLEKQVAFTISNLGLSWNEQTFGTPGPMARTVIDERGVKLVVW